MTGFGKVTVKSVAVNDAKRTITVSLNENGAYIPFTAERLNEFKSDCRKALGAKYDNYKVTVLAKKSNLDKLVLFAKKKNIGPTETAPFIVRHDKAAARPASTAKTSLSGKATDGISSRSSTAGSGSAHECSRLWKTSTHRAT